MPESRRRARNVLLWVGIGLIVLIGSIVLISALVETRSGEPVIENPGVLIGSVITATGGVLCVILPLLLRAESNSEAVRKEVEPVGPGHPPEDGTLRDEMTAGFERVDRGLRHAIDLGMNTAADLRGIRRDIGRNTDLVISTASRVGKLERRTDAIERRVDSLDPTEETGVVQSKGQDDE